MNFSKYDSVAKEKIAEYLKDSGYTGSDFSYQAFLCWYDNIEYTEENDVFFLRAFFNGEIRYWQPLIKSGNPIAMKDAVAMLPEGSTFAYVTAPFKDALGEDYVACSNPNWSEYVYNVKDFILMAGNKFSAKRNHIVRFKKLYNSEMNAFKREDIEDFMSLEGKWLEMHNSNDRMSESAKKESRIVGGWINAVLDGELICDVLRVEGKVVGVAIGEIEPSGNAIIIFEKADKAYEGVYTYIAHEFIVRNFSKCEFMNRQEDMGIEGLKKSKMSYNPAFLLDKYIVIPKKYCESDENGYIMPCSGDSALAETNDDYFELLSIPEMLSDSFSTEQDKIVAKIEEIRCASLDKYVFRQLKPQDFNMAMTFFENGIRNLDNKLHFMNYTDEELIEVLRDGYMLGAFYENHLVATCAFDPDKAYGDSLTKICADESGRQFYEFSGIMVCRYHRHKGLAHAICKRVIDYAAENYPSSTLCAVVQFDNVPSIINLSRFGFAQKAREIQEPYDFKYLTLEI